MAVNKSYSHYLSGPLPLRLLDQLENRAIGYAVLKKVSPSVGFGRASPLELFTYLSQWQWQRKVDCLDSISMAHYTRRVSDQHIAQIVKVRFEAVTHHFVASAVDGTELRRFTLTIISADYIQGVSDL